MSQGNESATKDIKYICEKHGINQTILGQILGISRQTFTNWKRFGIPKTRTQFIKTLKNINDISEFYKLAEDLTRPNVLRRACLEGGYSKAQLAELIGKPVGMIERAWLKKDIRLSKEVLAVGELALRVAKLENQLKKMQSYEDLHQNS